MKLKPIHKVTATIVAAATFCNIALDSTPVAACEEYAISAWDTFKLMITNIRYRIAERRGARLNPPLYVQLDRMNNK